MRDVVLMDINQIKKQVGGAEINDEPYLIAHAIQKSRKQLKH